MEYRLTPERCPEMTDLVHIGASAGASPPQLTRIKPYEDARAHEPRLLPLCELSTHEPEPAFREMTPATLRHRGRTRGSSARRWTGHSEPAIEHVETFRWIGEHRAPR